MKAYWQEAGAIDDKQLLQQIAAQAGLRSEDLAAAWEVMRRSHLGGAAPVDEETEE